MISELAMSGRVRFLLPQALVLTVLASPSVAGNNAGGSAFLSWDPTSSMADRQTVPTGTVPLYLRLINAPDVQSLAVQIAWFPFDSLSWTYTPRSATTGASCGSASSTPPTGGFEGDSTYFWSIQFPGSQRDCVAFEFDAGSGADTANFCALSVKVKDSAGQVDELAIVGGATIRGGHQQECPTQLEAIVPHSVTLGVTTELTVFGEGLDGVTSAELLGPSGTLQATSIEVLDSETAVVTLTIPDSLVGSLDVALHDPDGTRALLPNGVQATPEGSTLSMESSTGFTDCSQVVYSAPDDAAGCRRMLCSTAICPSIFSRPECPDVFSSVYACVMTFTSGGQPLANLPVRVEFYVQRWTGGHCHDDPSRPVVYQSDQHGNHTPLSAVERTTDANGVILFSFTAPEVASGLNLVPYSLDASRPYNTQRDTLQRICIRVPGLVHLAPPPPNQTFFILGGSAQRSSGHPAYHWALPEVQEGLHVLGQVTSMFFHWEPGLIEVGDASLQFGGLMDEHYEQTGLLPNWVPGLCLHRWGRSADIVADSMSPSLRQGFYSMTRMWKVFRLKIAPPEARPGFKTTLHMAPLAQWPRYHLEF